MEESHASRAYVGAVLLAMTAGFAPGVLVGRHWSREHAYRLERASERWAEKVRGRPTAMLSSRDSLERERPPLPSRAPAESRRMQAGEHCLVTFQHRDTVGGNLQLMHVRAHAEGHAVLSEGWRYQENGYAAGEIVSVVLPSTSCTDIRHLSHGASLVPTPEELERRSPFRLLWAPDAETGNMAGPPPQPAAR